MTATENQSKDPQQPAIKPSRTFKSLRTEFPAIFRFDGALYQEHFNIDANQHEWIEIREEEAMRWLAAATSQ